MLPRRRLAHNDVVRSATILIKSASVYTVLCVIHASSVDLDREASLHVIERFGPLSGCPPRRYCAGFDVTQRIEGCISPMWFQAPWIEEGDAVDTHIVHPHIQLTDMIGVPALDRHIVDGFDMAEVDYDAHSVSSGNDPERQCFLSFVAAAKNHRFSGSDGA